MSIHLDLDSFRRTRPVIRSVGPSPTHSPRTSSRHLLPSNANLSISTGSWSHGHPSPVHTPPLSASINNLTDLRVSPSPSAPIRRSSDSWAASNEPTVRWDISPSELPSASGTQRYKDSENKASEPKANGRVNHSDNFAQAYNNRPQNDLETSFRSLSMQDPLPSRVNAQPGDPVLQNHSDPFYQQPPSPLNNKAGYQYYSNNISTSDYFNVPQQSYNLAPDGSAFLSQPLPSSTIPSNGLYHPGFQPIPHPEPQPQYFSYGEPPIPISPTYAFYPQTSLNLQELQRSVSFQNQHLPPPITQNRSIPVSPPRMSGANPYSLVGYHSLSEVLQVQNAPPVENRDNRLKTVQRRKNQPVITSNGGFRSSLLDEFRSNRNRQWELKDLLGHIAEFSSDQHGSRFIQQQIEIATPEEKRLIFNEIVPQHALHLMQDVFGNYVIQKLFEHGSASQRSQLASLMERNLLPLSLQLYSCRVVQKALEYVNVDQQSIFIKELESQVLRCVQDANANHVIQKIIETVPPSRITFLNAFRGGVYELATHPYGCRVLQRCLEYLSEEQKRPLLEEIHKYSSNLMQNQFANYVIQFVLEHGKPVDRDRIIARLRGQMIHMSRHKFASNVCEKALLSADPDTRKKLVDEIISSPPGVTNPMATMMKDQFANYVLQKALTVSEGAQKALLVAKMRAQLANMRRTSGAYSKHLGSIERALDKIDDVAAAH